MHIIAVFFHFPVIYELLYTTILLLLWFSQGWRQGFKSCVMLRRVLTEIVRLLRQANINNSTLDAANMPEDSNRRTVCRAIILSEVQQSLSS